MAKHYQQTLSINESLERLVEASGQVLLKWGATPRLENGVVKGSTGISLSSWGENLSIGFAPDPNGVAVTVRSESAMSTTLVDWGKNKKQVERFFADMPPVLAALPKA